MSDRVTDYALLIGHVWRCPTCRESLLTQPEVAWIGFKLNDEQRQAIRNLSDESFVTIMRLGQELNLSTREIYTAIDHPRARLRHLGVVRGEYRSLSGR
jgi:3'-phosphoadenosine 5'-phosphosulfate sulfotransferase